MKVQILADELKRFSSLHNPKSDLTLISDGVGLEIKSEYEGLFVSNYFLVPSEPGATRVDSFDFFNKVSSLEGWVDISDKPLSKTSGREPKQSQLYLESKDSKFRITRQRAEGEELSIYEVSDPLFEFEMKDALIDAILKRSLVLENEEKPFLGGIQLNYKAGKLLCYSSNGVAFSKILISGAEVNSEDPFTVNIPYRIWKIARSLVLLQKEIAWITDSIADAEKEVTKENAEVDKEPQKIKVAILENNLVRFQLGDQKIVAPILSQTFPEDINKFFVLKDVPYKITLQSSLKRKLKALEGILRKDAGNVILKVRENTLEWLAENNYSDGLIETPNEPDQAFTEASLVLPYFFFNSLQVLFSDQFTMNYGAPEGTQIDGLGAVLRPVIFTSHLEELNHWVVQAVLNPRQRR